MITFRTAAGLLAWLAAVAASWALIGLVALGLWTAATALWAAL